MFEKLFTRPLRLRVGGRWITFNSVVDFEFGLASRTEVPAGKVAELIRLSPAELKREAKDIKQAEKRLVEVLSRSLQNPGTIGAQLRDLDAGLFSQDHQWRYIFAALSRHSSRYDEFRKIALVKYVQYLASRQDVLRSIYTDKRANPAPAPVADPDEAAANAPDPSLKDTVIFDVKRLRASLEQGANTRRLPRGETVDVRVGPGQDVEIALSRHVFKLLPGSPFTLVDEHGSSHVLRPGRNTVGRDLSNDVVVDSRYRDVSRTHVVVEPRGEDLARLTDLSSHGTFLTVRKRTPVTE